jgi:hypothetical protein
MQITHLFSAILVAANTARDVGGRLAAIAIWGTRASGGKYAAIAALTNILATVAAYAFYEFVFKDSNRCTSCTGHSPRSFFLNFFFYPWRYSRYRHWEGVPR